MNHELRIMKLLEIRNLKLVFATMLLASYFLLRVPSVLADNPPQSATYKLSQFGFGSGGSLNSVSTNYGLQGILVQIESGNLSSLNYQALPGLTYTLQPNVPAAPTIVNTGGNNYNKLHITIDNGSNSTDTTFIIQVASNSSNFTSDVYYVQTDHTLGTTVTSQTYANWNSSTGIDMIGLYPNTTYYARVAGVRGTYTQGKYSASANAATVNPSLTFTLTTTSQGAPPYSVYIGNIVPGSIATSTDKINTTISTNGTNGGLIYIYGTNNGLKSAIASNHIISSTSNDLSSGGVTEGYGARGTTVTQTSGGPMRIDPPYNGSGQNVGIINTTQRQAADSTGAPVVGGQFNFELKAKAGTYTPAAGDYTDTITVIGTGSF